MFLFERSRRLDNQPSWISVVIVLVSLLLSYIVMRCFKFKQEVGDKLDEAMLEAADQGREENAKLDKGVHDDVMIEHGTNRPIAKIKTVEEKKVEVIPEQAQEDNLILENIKAQDNNEPIEEDKVEQEANKIKKQPIEEVSAGALGEIFPSSIKKTIAFDQLENTKGFREVESTGKVSWMKTHFIFMIDCSASMGGEKKWDSVVAGYHSCLNHLTTMKDIRVSALTFDIKVNVFCKDKTPAQAIEDHNEPPFTADSINYKVALEAAIEIAKDSAHSDYLLCMFFLSDGLAEYPEDAIAELKKMREEGRKIVFYTIGCATDQEQVMIKMAESLKGEHYKVIDPEASRLVFSTILKV